MTAKHPPDLSQLSMLELFRLEVDTQVVELTRGLLQLERNPAATDELPSLMRAAHSLKGAARIVNREAAVRIAHAMEDCLTAFSSRKRVANSKQVDGLLAAVDLLVEIATLSDPDLANWTERKTSEMDALLLVLAGHSAEMIAEPVSVSERPLPVVAGETSAVRVSSENLGRLLFLAGESLVVSHRFDEHARDLQRLKRRHHELGRSIGRMRERIAGGSSSEPMLADLFEVEQRSASCAQSVADVLSQGDSVNRQFFNLSRRLHQEVLDCRMRPLSEAIGSLERMVRDIGRELGKSVRLEIAGAGTAVDRDILERLNVPLMHLIRNAVDHGIENPRQRRAGGKPEVGVIRLEACHRGGMLIVSVADDGIGIDREALRAAIVRKGLTTAEAVEKMSDTEVNQFLFLPGFSMKETVTAISGRGIGLDVVQTTIREIGGTIRLVSAPHAGSRFDLELPLTLSLIRALLVDIAGEPYAFPLARITGVAKLARQDIRTIEGRQHFRFRGAHVGLITARQVMEVDGPEAPEKADIAVVVISDEHGAHYGLAVDRFLGERELVVLGLDPALEKIRTISAGALMPDDSPVLILDVDDLLRAVEAAISATRIEGVATTETLSIQAPRKRILAVDDSLTVRELERKLLQSRGYEVETAVDGMDAWNMVRSGHFDLIVTDIDMPRMDGIELLQLIRKDTKLQAVPVMVVSYKDREEDRRRGLDAGADYYLTKGSFHDESLLQAVTDLIGEAGA